jgi:pimeloyl-ACP methyl ester carboxylesterase
VGADVRFEELRLRGAGIELQADAWGDPASPPVLLMHGGGQTRHAWGGTAGVLAAQGWYAVSLDLRGHGESDWSPDGAYHLDHFVDDLRAVSGSLATLPVLVGASLGGMTAMAAEGEQPGSAGRALVLVDVGHRLERQGVERIIEFMTADLAEGFASLEEAAASVARFMPHRPPPRDLTGLRKNLREGPDGRWRWHWDPRFMGVNANADDTLPAGVPRIADPDRLERAARGLRLPTLLVRGRMSDVLSEEGAREFLREVPHARFVDVSGASHMVAGDRNDVFTAAVASFLRGLDESGRSERAEG